MLQCTSFTSDRSFPSHKMFMEGTSEGKEGRAALFRVLAVYALYNPEVSYCQGNNLVQLWHETYDEISVQRRCHCVVLSGLHMTNKSWPTRVGQQFMSVNDTTSTWEKVGQNRDAFYFCQHVVVSFKHQSSLSLCGFVFGSPELNSTTLCK